MSKDIIKDDAELVNAEVEYEGNFHVGLVYVIAKAAKEYLRANPREIPADMGKDLYGELLECMEIIEQEALRGGYGFPIEEHNGEHSGDVVNIAMGHNPTASGGKISISIGHNAQTHSALFNLSIGHNARSAGGAIQISIGSNAASGTTVWDRGF